MPIFSFLTPVSRILPRSQKTRIIAILACLGLMPVAGAAVDFISLSRTARAYADLETASKGAAYLERMNGLVFAVVMESRGIYMSADAKAAKPFSEHLLKYLSELEGTIKSWKEAVIESQRKNIEDVEVRLEQFTAFRRELVRRGLEVGPPAAREYGDNDANRTARRALNDALNATAVGYSAEVSRARERIAANDRTLMSTLLGLAAAGIIALAVAIALVKHGLITPLLRIRASMGRLSNGETAFEVPERERGDEIGEMARAVETFRLSAIEKLRLEAAAAADRERAEHARLQGEAEKKERDRQAEIEKQHAEEAKRVAADAAIAMERELVTRSIGAALARLAEKDLTIRIGEDLPAAYQDLKSDFNSAAAELERAMTMLTQHIGGINSDAGHISSAAENLSRRTETQAASLEQMTAAIQQVSDGIRKAATASDRARAFIEKARVEAEAGGAVVRQATNAMAGIEASSHQIEKIIGLIDDIAFQTNLLSLNAGVEAARAGDAGRGFAVVASEVRALAQRSAESARDIRVLISKSERQVKDGVQLVADSGSAMQRIVAQIGDMTSLVTEIASSANEQAAILKEVTEAINEIDRATQQNAAMAEESTAAVQSLKTEADQLAGTAATFRMGASKDAVIRQELSKLAHHVFRNKERPAPRSAAVSKPKRATSAHDADWREF